MLTLKTVTLFDVVIILFGVILPPLRGETKHKLFITSDMELSNTHFSKKAHLSAIQGAFI